MNDAYWIALYHLLKAIEANLESCPQPVREAYLEFQKEKHKGEFSS